MLDGMKKEFGIAMVAGMLNVAPADASSVVIDFEEFQTNTVGNFVSIVDAPLITKGFKFIDIPSSPGHEGFGFLGNLHPSYKDTDLQNHYLDETIVTIVGGGVFRIKSLEATTFGNDNHTLTINAITKDGVEVAQDFDLIGSNWGSYNFNDDFNEITSFSWRADTLSSIRIDNIDITTVPISPAYMLFSTSLLGLAALGRRYTVEPNSNTLDNNG